MDTGHALFRQRFQALLDDAAAANRYWTISAKRWEALADEAEAHGLLLPAIVREMGLECHRSRCRGHGAPRLMPPLHEERLMTTPETTMPSTEAALEASKPSQSQLDTAAQARRWLAAHARLFPEEYGEQLGISQQPVDVFVAAANACWGRRGHARHDVSPNAWSADAFDARLSATQQEECWSTRGPSAREGEDDDRRRQ